MYLYRYTDDCTKGRVSRVEGKAVSKGPPQSLPDHLRKLPILVLTISLAS